MITSKIANVLLGHHVTEKSALLRADSNQYVFMVAKDANKHQIKDAVEKLLDVKVDSVTVLNNKGKVKRFGYRLGRRNDWKKAYVRIAEGQTIQLLESE
ncbi:MAG: 50S ribosomal protein L23 [Gammaproteobacteria bacterium]|jgi:large subunit ribosomal protein L23|nr:50S ribosomal protein L23 [Gammaproteobacteria bacterium]